LTPLKEKKKLASTRFLFIDTHKHKLAIKYR